LGPHGAQTAAARLDDLDTPAVLIDLDRVEANIAKAQAYAERHRLALRPHVKTHKLPTLAHRQVREGAVGVTAQKISEALVMAHAGLDDVLLSYPIVGTHKVEPLARLARATRALAVMLDNETPLTTVAAAAAGAGDFVRETRALMAADGIEAPVFSGGGTPTMWQAHEHAELTELRVGDRVRIVPNHACPVSNLDDFVVAHRGDRVAWVAPVWARGATR